MPVFWLPHLPYLHSISVDTLALLDVRMSAESRKRHSRKVAQHYRFLFSFGNKCNMSAWSTNCVWLRHTKLVRPRRETVNVKLSSGTWILKCVDGHSFELLLSGSFLLLADYQTIRRVFAQFTMLSPPRPGSELRQTCPQREATTGNIKCRTALMGLNHVSLSWPIVV